MSARAWYRLGAASGVLHVVVVLIGFAIHGATPSVGASTSDVTTFVTNAHPTQVWVGNYIEATGYTLFLVFAACLYGTVRHEDPSWSWLPITALAAAVAYVAVSIGPGIALQEATVQWGKRGLTPEVVGGISDLADDVFFLSFIVAALFLAAISAAMLRARALPAWLGWSGTVIALLMLAAGLVSILSSGSAFSMNAFLLFALWTVVTSVYVLVRSDTLQQHMRG